jgi:SpoVK/Ycf46/Vps4 family AAA+-type ATPase
MGITLEFGEVPGLSRGDVVLPEQVLKRVERHALAVAAHRAKLLDAGQHLKRGLLLHGPPGTGKTHTMRYLLGQMRDYTRLVLTGRALHAVGSVAEIARDLQPAVVVLEDVDLVAEERGFGPGASPVLFDLLDAMDGAAPDADLLFVLTTNRADLLEPALAARPGRVDVAVEIDLPGSDARRRLLALYGRGLSLRLSESEVTDIVERTEGSPRPSSKSCFAALYWRRSTRTPRSSRSERRIWSAPWMISSTAPRRSPAACSGWATIRRLSPPEAEPGPSRRPTRGGDG